MLTTNEKIVLKHLLIHFDRESSINQIAKNCRLSPNGAYKILKKLEKEEVLQCKQVANVKSYSLNFSSPKTKLVVQLAFMEKVSPEIAQKLTALQPWSGWCFFWDSEKKAVIVTDVLEKVKLPKVKGIKISIISQEALLAEKEMLQSALLLWGHDKLAELFCNVT